MGNFDIDEPSTLMRKWRVATHYYKPCAHAPLNWPDFANFSKLIQHSDSIINNNCTHCHCYCINTQCACMAMNAQIIITEIFIYATSASHIFFGKDYPDICWFACIVILKIFCAVLNDTDRQNACSFKAVVIAIQIAEALLYDIQYFICRDWLLKKVSGQLDNSFGYLSQRA